MVKEHLNEIKHYLKDTKTDLQKSDTWDIQLTLFLLEWVVVDLEEEWKKASINLKNEDDKYFQCAVTEKLNGLR